MLQAVTDHYQVLLNQGAGVPGSLAEARLARLIRDSGEVLASQCHLAPTTTCPTSR